MLIFSFDSSFDETTKWFQRSEPCQTSRMEGFAKIVNNWKLLNIFTKHSILDDWQSSEYTFGSGPKWFKKILWSILLGQYRDNLDLNEITHFSKSWRKWRVEYKGDLYTLIIYIWRFSLLFIILFFVFILLHDNALQLNFFSPQFPKINYPVFVVDFFQ